MEILYFIGTYLIGFFITLTFLKLFGKRIGFDYDGGSTWIDEWQSNAEAYIVFSFMWFIFIPALIIFSAIKILCKASEWYLKL